MSRLVRIRPMTIICVIIATIAFVFGTAGRDYGIGHLRKLQLALRILSNYVRMCPLVTLRQNLLLVEEILRVPPSMRGDVIECGSYNGGSTVNLSLACALTNRRLFVCDSFEGLPNPRNDEKYEIHVDAVDYYAYEKGEFASEGGLDGVMKKVKDFGDIGVCQFVKGYFKDTLQHIPSDFAVLIFEDVDLPTSVADCLRYLWPKLREGCKFFCHEPWSISVVSLFFDRKWWAENLQTSPPGFYGSGHGIVAYGQYSNIGYALKFDPEKIKACGKRIVHRGSKSSTAR